MTILFTKCLVLVYSIVMCLAVQENTDDFYGINCKIKKSFTNELITPFIEQPSEVTGCYSNSAAITNEEIHVLSLINTGNDVVDTKSGYLPSVTVDVQLRSKKKFSMSSTTIILHSFTPVMWQINLDHIGNSTNFHVIVNKPSFVVPTIAATISRRKFPSMKRLPLWIKSHYGAVTSYSLIHFANEIILFLGADLPLSSKDCDFSSKTQSLNVKANFVQLQLATGCTVSDNAAVDKNKVLYVIEVDSKALNSETRVHLQQHTNSDFTWNSVIEQNVVLILKSNVLTEWIVESTGIQGSLLIVAEHPVHIRTNVLFVTTKIQKQTLPSSTSVLLSNVKNSFGSIDTFIKTSKVNRINIVIKGKIKTFEETILSKNLSMLDYVNGPTSPWSSITSFFTEKNKLHIKNNESKVLPSESWDTFLANHMFFSCSGEKFSIALPLEETLQIFASTLGPDYKLLSISMSDINCKARQNKTHIILQSKFTDCGTKNVIHGGLQYHNQIQFITTKQELDNVSLNEQKHIPADDDDYISEYGSGSNAISFSLSQNEESIIYPLPFHCEKSVKDNDAHKPPSDKYELNLFTKKEFKQIVHSFPLDVNVHDHLFAQASIKDDSRLCIVIDECWLSETSSKSKNSGKKNTLIKQGCPTDLSVDILTKSHCSALGPDADHYKMRFSFQLSEELMDQNLYLHCRLTSCAMQDSKDLNTNQCISDEYFCLKQSLRPYLDTLFGKKYTMIVKGPFRVVPKIKMEKKKEILSFVNPESSSSPENFVVDYSFDKLTRNTKKNPVSQQLVFVGLSTEAVVGIAFASFIIGAGLMATLWLIHMYTEPSRRFKQSRKELAKQSQNVGQLNSERLESTDNSTLCSAKPLSVQVCA